MRAHVVSAVVLSRGMAGPVESCPILSAAEPYDASAPNPDGRLRLLDARERRRTTSTMRLALDVAERCVTASDFAAHTLPAIFGSAFGDGPLLGSLLNTLATPGARVSPTKFHNSVHNAALGYWSIAARCREGGTSIAAGDNTAGTALLRGLVQISLEARPVLVVVYDAPFDPPLSAVRPVAAPFAAAILLAPDAAEAVCRLDVDLADGPNPVTPPTNGSLRELWGTNPAARSIPLLETIARRRAAITVIAHSGHGALRIQVTPC